MKFSPCRPTSGHSEEFEPMRVLATALVVGGGALAVVNAASAQGDPAAGHALAQEWCASCHAIEPMQPTPPGSPAPSWSAVARMPSTTSMALHAFLLTPHVRMPDLRLTPAQIDDVVAYILSLRRQ
jgi:mono/diheme cytochrome c family protein